MVASTMTALCQHHSYYAWELTKHEDDHAKAHAKAQRHGQPAHAGALWVKGCSSWEGGAAGINPGATACALNATAAKPSHLGLGQQLIGDD